MVPWSPGWKPGDDAGAIPRCAAFPVVATPMSLGRLWRMIDHHHGQYLNASEFGRSLGETHKTIQRHLEMLSAAFMIRLLPPWFANLGKRLVRRPKIYVRDSGLLHALLGIDVVPLDEAIGIT